MSQSATAVARCFKRWGTDWLYERARFPGIALSVAVALAAPAVHLTVGTVLAVNWAVGKFPTAYSMVQAIRIGQWRRWSRPQAYQDPSVSDVTKPPETDDKEWKVPGWQRKLTAAAEHNRVAAVLDDWLNERSRVPALVIDLASVGLAHFIGLPVIAIFVINWGLTQIPFANSLGVGALNGSWRRANRPGSFQRNRERRGLRLPEAEVQATALQTAPFGHAPEQGLSKRPVGLGGAAAQRLIVASASAPRLRTRPGAVVGGDGLGL